MNHFFLHGIKLFIPGQKWSKPKYLGYYCVFLIRLLLHYLFVLHMQIILSYRASFQKKHSFRFYHSKNISMFELLCSIGMAFWVLVLVKVGNKGFHLGQGQYEWGFFTSRFKTDISCLIPSLSWNNKAQKLSRSKEVFFLKSSPGEAWKGISAEGRQSSSGRFIEGTRFSRKDWPQHPWPAGRAAFYLPGAFVF